MFSQIFVHFFCSLPFLHFLRSLFCCSAQHLEELCSADRQQLLLGAVS